MRRMAVIDLGSHSNHLEVFEVPHSKSVRSIFSKSELSYLGRTVEATGRITPHERAHLRSTLMRLARKARKKKASPILIVATSGYRKADNGQDVIKELTKTAKIPVHLLTTDRESELGFLGIRSDLTPGAATLFIDAGGGSTEVVLARGRKRLSHHTIPLGNEVLCIEVKNDPPSVYDLLSIVQCWSKFTPSLPKAPHLSGAFVRGSSVKDLLNLLPDDSRKVITQAHLDDIAVRLLRKKKKKITRKYDIEPACVPALLPAAMTVAILMRHYGLNRMAITSKGLRDGVVLDYLAHPRRWHNSSVM
jgi:exopolyphosphatase / guanosine-5'-triphosphate,3'-diphosphate pyrophosphatase